MSMSNNMEYSFMKRRAGLHNWGFYSSRYEFDFDLDEMEEMEVEEVYSSEIVHQNAFGEYYALQDYEE